MNTPRIRPELLPEQQALLVRALRDALGGATRIELIETHSAYVLVGATDAYKIKKALDLGFLDYSTCERRRLCCERELQLNRRLAPALYLDCQPISGSPDAPVLGGTGPAIDHAVHMLAFDQAGLWDRLAALGTLRENQIDELADQIATFHASGPPADPDSRFGRPGQVRAPMLENLRVLRGYCAETADHAALDELDRWEAAEFARVAPIVERRRLQGRVRECHGDLHLANVATIDGRTTVFDCIEFNDDFRWIDIAGELAFMAMDLHHHGLPRLAHRFVNRYLERSGDYDAVRVLRYQLVYRALVRAKVEALRAAQPGAAAQSTLGMQRHLQAAAAFARQHDAALLITHGLSGSGKSTGALARVQERGAIRIRADVERKRLLGLDAGARTGSAPGRGVYGEEATAATYTRLLDLAQAVLDGGRCAIVDATFLRRSQRDQARALAARAGVPFGILNFSADEPTLRRRVIERAAHGDDPSEAGLAVLEMQMRCAEPLQADELGAVQAGPVEESLR